MRMACHVKEVKLAVPPLDLTARLELQEPCDQPGLRMKGQRVQHARRAGAVCRGVLGKGELKERVELDAFAAAPRVFENHPAGRDVARADERVVEGGEGWWRTVQVQYPQIPVAQVPASIGHAQRRVEQAVEANQRLGIARRV